MAKIGWRARFFRWLSDVFRPGDRNRESARVAYSAYLNSGEVESLDAAIEHYQVAVDQYRKHNRSSLVKTLINYAVVVWEHYETCGKSPTDLNTVIRLDTEAHNFWSGKRESKPYVTLLNTLAEAYFEQYQGSNVPEEKQMAFENAVKFYTDLKSNSAVTASQRSRSQIQLGVIYYLQCELDKNLDKLDIGIGNLKEAKLGLEKETNTGEQAEDAKQSKKAEVDEIMATCLLSLATSYDVRYKLRENPDDLNMAIDYNKNAKPLLEKFGRHELPACLFNLGRLLRLRWQRTKASEDYRNAKEMAEAAKATPGLEQGLEQRIDELLGVLQPGTLDSALSEGLDSPQSVHFPRHQDTVSTMGTYDTTPIAY